MRGRHAAPHERGRPELHTIELKTNFLGSARTGEVVHGRARIAHAGRTTQVWDVEVRNETRDRVIALFRCTQMILFPKA